MHSESQEFEGFSFEIEQTLNLNKPNAPSSPPFSFLNEDEIQDLETIKETLEEPAATEEPGSSPPRAKRSRTIREFEVIKLFDSTEAFDEWFSDENRDKIWKM